MYSGFFAAVMQLDPVVEVAVGSVLERGVIGCHPFVYLKAFVREGGIARVAHFDGL